MSKTDEYEIGFMTDPGSATFPLLRPLCAPGVSENVCVHKQQGVAE